MPKPVGHHTLVKHIVINMEFINRNPVEHMLINHTKQPIRHTIMPVHNPDPELNPELNRKDYHLVRLIIQHEIDIFDLI